MVEPSDKWWSEWKSVGMTFSIWWESHKICSKPPTRYGIFLVEKSPIHPHPGNLSTDAAAFASTWWVKTPPTHQFPPLNSWNRWIYAADFFGFLENYGKLWLEQHYDIYDHSAPFGGVIWCHLILHFQQAPCWPSRSDPSHRFRGNFPVESPTQICFFFPSKM